MELVIKLSDKEYSALQSASYHSFDKYTAYLAMKNGILLPEHHGDLIDRRELKKEVYTTTEWNGDIHRIIYEASIDDAKPIIEGSEKK